MNFNGTASEKFTPARKILVDGATRPCDALANENGGLVMGVDLRLLPLLGQDYWVSHDMLSFERRYKLWDAIRKIESHQIPQPLHCYLAQSADGEGPSYGDVSLDPYGDHLRWVHAGDLAGLRQLECASDDWKNRAVFAYLDEMPKSHKIVLWWY